MTVEVHQHGAVGVALALGPVVYAQGGGRYDVGLRRTTNQAQQCVSAHHGPECPAEACARRSAQRQAHGGELPSQTRRPPGPSHGHTRQAFGEDATRAVRSIAEQASDLQPDRNGIRPPGQVGQGPLVATMDALGPPVAEWATCGALSSAHGNGNGGGSGFTAPCFQPNAGGFRQQTREKIFHPI